MPGSTPSLAKQETSRRGSARYPLPHSKTTCAEKQSRNLYLELYHVLPGVIQQAGPDRCPVPLAARSFPWAEWLQARCQVMHLRQQGLPLMDQGIGIEAVHRRVVERGPFQQRN